MAVLRYNYFKKLQEMFVNQENSLSTVDTLPFLIYNHGMEVSEYHQNLI